MTIDQKINFRANAIFYLQTNQYLQLITLDMLILAPYYKDRLSKQAKEVSENERFKSTFGKSRYELENNIR